MFSDKDLYVLNEDFTILKIPDPRMPVFIRMWIMTVKTGKLEGLKFEFYDWNIELTDVDSVSMGVNYKILSKPKVDITQEELVQQINLYVMSYLRTMKDTNDRRY